MCRKFYFKHDFGFETFVEQKWPLLYSVCAITGIAGSAPSQIFRNEITLNVIGQPILFGNTQWDAGHGTEWDADKISCRRQNLG